MDKANFTPRAKPAKPRGMKIATAKKTKKRPAKKRVKSTKYVAGKYRY